MAATLTLNRPPAITWHRLRANGTTVELPGAAADTAREWLSANATERRKLVCADGGETVVEIAARPGEIRATALEVTVPAGVEAKLVIHTDGQGEGEREAAAPSAGVAGVACRVHAQAGSRLELELLQTLDGGFTYLEWLDLNLADGARVDVRQTVLGGAKSFVGTTATLAGENSAADFDVRYLGRGDAQLDFNYAFAQRGAGTTVDLAASGILADESRKIFRDTIDLVHGCKGARGTEVETVLLLGEGVSNISLPVILCDEDDVQGDHGVTIGHVDADQLQYLATRGLSEEQAEALFLEAVFDYALLHASTASGRAAIRRLAAASGVAGDGDVAVSESSREGE